MIERDYCETDLSGEVEEERQLAHQHAGEMRDIEQGCSQFAPGEDEQ
jgi:hypothetical protein